MNFYTKSKKSLGQNFLIDKNIIKKIVDIGDIENNKTVYEIGPGYGSLTKEILERKPKKIYAIEKDKYLSNHLNNTFKNNKNVKIINKDILSIIKEKIIDKNVVVFGNLPYNISTQILASLALTSDWPPWYKSLIFMFQKEVADRIIAKEKSKEFGRLSIMSNWRLKITKHFDVSNNCFSPKPKISSTVLSFQTKKNYSNIKNPINLEIVTRILFSNRRKMINKSFIKLFNGDKSVAKKLNIDLSKRAEELNFEAFYKITKIYEKLNC